MTTIEKAQSASVFFFFLSSSRFHLSMHVRTIFTYVYLPFSLFYLYSLSLFFAFLIAIVIIRFDNFWREKNGEMQESKV